jgi:hypothetical protein
MCAFYWNAEELKSDNFGVLWGEVGSANITVLVDVKI